MSRAGGAKPRSPWWALGVVPLALAACSSGGASGGGSTGVTSPDAKLKDAGSTVQAHMRAYHSKAAACKAASSPVVCLEAADRALGDQIHTYANVLAVGHGFTAPRRDQAAARNAAQTLANSLEILGDAQPTQANYDQVQNTFNVSTAIGQLQRAVTTLDNALG